MQKIWRNYEKNCSCLTPLPSSHSIPRGFGTNFSHLGVTWSMWNWTSNGDRQCRCFFLSCELPSKLICCWVYHWFCWNERVVYISPTFLWRTSSFRSTWPISQIIYVIANKITRFLSDVHTIHRVCPLLMICALTCTSRKTSVDEYPAHQDDIWNRTCRYFDICMSVSFSENWRCLKRVYPRIWWFYHDVRYQNSWVNLG